MAESSNDPLGAFGGTPAGIPHIIEYLWTKYRETIATGIQSRKDRGVKTIELGEALDKTTAKQFVRWASNFLNEHRTVENFFVDANHGLRLSNNDLVVVSPGQDLRGTMQDSGAVGVTEGRSQPGNDGVVQVNDALRIT